MFCPRCATENDREQGYCRQCGQRLLGVRLALEGSTDQSLEKLKAGEEWIKGGSAILVVFGAIALAIGLFGVAVAKLEFGYIALINILLGSFIGLPIVYFGKSKVKGAARLLMRSETETTPPLLDQAQPHLLNQSQPPNELLTSGLNKDLASLPPPASVTEHTTLDLKRSNIEIEY